MMPALTRSRSIAPKRSCADLAKRTSFTATMAPATASSPPTDPTTGLNRPSTGGKKSSPSSPSTSNRSPASPRSQRANFGRRTGPPPRGGSVTIGSPPGRRWANVAPGADEVANSAHNTKTAAPSRILGHPGESGCLQPGRRRALTLRRLLGWGYRLEHGENVAFGVLAADECPDRGDIHLVTEQLSTS